ncbi:CHAT domain-containing protein [Glycomyces terrestris]|uniref:CHAT domain-containing protein n=1 Tax=Glycomyces terrestris TaxID=2493553 RepID=A0A426UWF3_9ACTN|nr:CHAT domain-containing protein [Glycomyces terrestris]RRR98654.1 CHAT domain-containing protein [Glycomyces terrestris]
MKEYDELRIRLRRIGTQRYLAVANGAAAGAAVLDVGDEPARLREAHSRLVDVDLHRAPRRGADTAAELRAVGAETYALLFGGPLGRCLDAARAAQRSRGLRLRFDLPPELADLPVETLCAPSDQPGQTFAFDSNLSLVRSLPGNPVRSRLPFPEDGREAISTLIAVASPDGLPELGGDAEIAALADLLPPLLARQEVIRHATRDRIEAWLEAQQGPAAVHLIAHGERDARGGIASVLLETAGGAPDAVPGDLLGGMLVNAPKLRLVVLNLCHSAGSGPAEPFSGLAEALVGRGIPAVVGMRGLITDLAAREVGPRILDGMCANKSVDEAVVSARQRIAHHGDTAVEWGTPTLFLHEDCGHGWLFKAREMHDGDTGDVDFLRAGKTAVDLVEGDGELTRDAILRAARFRRWERDWEAVLRTVKVRNPTAALKLLRQEAELELAWPAVERLCAALAAEQGAAAADIPGLPADVAALLDAEAAADARLHALMEAAAAAEAAEDWDEAADRYRRVLAERGRGYRDAAARLRAAAEEAGLDERYARAAAYEADGRWADARAQFNRILTARPQGLRDTADRAAYAGGRIAEDAEDWDAAAADYERCAAYADAAARLELARGRRLAAAGDWDAAAERLAAAAAAGLDIGHWPGYAAARAAEAAGDWHRAAAAFAAADGFADSARRAVLAAAHLAYAASEWLTAAEHFDQVPDLADRPGDLAGRLLAAAEHDEAAGEWRRAAAAYRRLPDAAEQTAYCEARALELDGRWSEAADRHRATGHRDAALRARYADARSAERRGDWDTAGALHAALPAGFADAAARVKYAAGRAADARDDWDGTIAGFADLADGFEDGEVGRRRRHARAAAAAAEADWASVLPLLGDTPAEARDGAAGRLRHRARGELAEHDGDWTAAAAAFDAAGDEERGRYAVLRAHAAAGAWTDLLALAADLPDDHRDTAHWRRYARAQQAAQDARWADVLDACDGLPDGFGDSAALARRAAFHRAFDAAFDSGDWSAVADLAAGLGDEHRTAALDAYARGRTSEQDGDWAAAADAYRACPGLADADTRARYAEARHLEETGRWTAAAAAYEAAGLAEALARADRLRGLRRALPWAERLLTAGLVADPLAEHDPAHPYTALAAAGIGPDASADEIDAAPFTLMRLGGMSAESRLAWDRLRDPVQRLLTDTLHHWSRDRAALGRALSGLDLDGDPLAQLCERLPEEAPLFTLLSGRRDEAVGLLRRRAAARPGDRVDCHRLAAAEFWRASELERIGAWEAAEDSWRTSLACWATLAGDDAHWAAWAASRSERYGRAVTPADAWRLRAELGAHLSGVLTGRTERHARGGRAGLAGRGRELVSYLDTELEAARALREAGGLPLDGERPLACGPGYLAVAGLADALARFTAALDADESADETVARRLRWAFSPSARAFTEYERRRYDAAAQALPDLHRLPRADLPPDCEGPDAAGHPADCAHCADWAARAPAYGRLPHRRIRLHRDAIDLAVRIRLFGGQSLLAEGRVQDAMGEFRTAVAVAANGATQVKTREGVLRIILGRVRHLVDTDDRRHTRLDDAIALLEAAQGVAGPVGVAELDRELARRLVDRALYRWSADRTAPVAALLPDMRRALSLDPAADRAVESHARFLVIASDRTPADRPAARLELLTEALEHIDARVSAGGLNNRVRSSLVEVVDEIKDANFAGLSVAEISAIVDSYSEHDTARSLTARAESRTLAGDLTRAADDLVRAVLLEPGSGGAARALIGVLKAQLAEGRSEP